MNITNIEVKFITSIAEVSCDQWNSIVSTDYPFIRHEFLAALESSGCVCAESGWQPHHLLAYDQDSLLAVMPLYIKTHSYGEYVFDFQWANAFHQSGFEYYPKLLTAIPFTPCAGTRIVTKPDCSVDLSVVIIDKVIENAKKLGVSSWHLLFPETSFPEKIFSEPQLASDNQNSKLMLRLSMQYHWYNRNYSSFEDFLGHCKMKRRKNIKRERKQIEESGVNLEFVEGKDIDKILWQQFFYFYRRTYAKRSGNIGYLNQKFFEKIGKTMASNILMVVASFDEKTIAISLFFKDDKNLYGRYWGAEADYNFLHFEACYYKGIEYCIENELQHFDAGAQGEHKIQRGFEPIETYSYHWINDQRFSEAIQNFVDEEAEYVKQGINELKKKLPFKSAD